MHVHDLLVLGAGTAGLPAAIFAARRGLRVLLVEKLDRVGGTLHVAQGQLAAAGTSLQRERGIEDSPELHFADVMRISRGTANEEMVRLAVGAAAGTIEWLRAAGFATLVTDEIVFDHVAARYVATGSTRRVGVDAGVSLRPVPLLRIDADLTWADGVYVATGEAIPYAPRLLVVGGAYAERLPVGPVLLTAGLRGVVLGPRPLPGGFASHTAVSADLTTTVTHGPWGLTLDIDNVLGNQWRDGEFVFASRWDLDEPAAELPVRHFTAGTPLAARLAVSRRF